MKFEFKIIVKIIKNQDFRMVWGGQKWKWFPSIMQILHLKKTQKLNTKTAIKKGKVDRVIEYSPDDLDHKFRERYHDILSQKKGGVLFMEAIYYQANVTAIKNR